MSFSSPALKPQVFLAARTSPDNEFHNSITRGKEMTLDRFLNLLPDPFIPVLSGVVPAEGLRRGNGREGRA